LEHWKQCRSYSLDRECERLRISWFGCCSSLVEVPY